LAERINRDVLVLASWVKLLLYRAYRAYRAAGAARCCTAVVLKVVLE
jgi:hypothetical protein